MRISALALFALSLGCSKPANPEPRAQPEPSGAAAAAAPRAPASAASSSAGSAHVPPRACPKMFTGAPAAWKTRVLAASSEAARNAALADIGVSPLEDGANEDGKPWPPWRAVRVTSATYALGGAAPDDVWVDVRFEQTREEGGGVREARALRTAALVKQPDGSLCALAGPSDEQDFRDSACLGNVGDWPAAVSFAHVTDARRFTVVAEPTHGRCGGCGRSGHHDVVLYDVQGFELAPVFDAVLYDADYEGCPMPPATWVVASVEWVGAFPKDILLTSEIGCAGANMLAPGTTSTCKPSATETRSKFRGAAYEKIATRPVPAPYEMHVDIDDAGLDDGSGRAWAGLGFKRLGEGKLDESERYSKLAVARATDVEIRASALFNLALVAERRGDAKAACARLAESLAIRPGNATTQKKREELCR